MGVEGGCHDLGSFGVSGGLGQIGDDRGNGGSDAEADGHKGANNSGEDGDGLVEGCIGHVKFLSRCLCSGGFRYIDHIA